MTLSFSDPEETGGLRLNPKDIIGHLLLVWAVDYIAHSPTQYSRPDKPSDVIVVDVVDLHQAGEDGQPGLVARRCWWRQALLIQSLKSKIGDLQPVLAVMDKGAGTMGRAAPFVLTNMKSDPRSVEWAQAWAARNPGFKPSSAGPPAPEPPMDPWEKQPPLPPARPATPQQQTMLERMAQSSVSSPVHNYGPQDQGNIPF